MSTREKALSIFNKLNERQLEGFIAMYNGIFTVEDESCEEQSEQAKRDEAFDELEQIRKTIKPVSADFDEKAEYLAYLDERYGI